MGDCTIIGYFKKIEETLKCHPCRVGGMVTCQEEEKEYHELLAQGKISELEAEILKIRYPNKEREVFMHGKYGNSQKAR